VGFTVDNSKNSDASSGKRGTGAKGKRKGGETFHFSFEICGFKFEVPTCDPEGRETVAGGRSEEKTTG
jgi:hypothetical protein